VIDLSSAANITDPLAAHGHGGVTKKKITFDESRLGACRVGMRVDRLFSLKLPFRFFRKA
jgi:hypothetical protein